MRPSLLLVLGLALGAASCASSARSKPRPHAAARPPLSPEARKQVDRKYYEAVDAYMKTDYAQSRALIREILSADPGHPDAQAFLARVKAVEKASATQ